MSIESAIDRFRGKQAEQFSETVTITRPIGEATFDDETGEYAQATETAYDGPAKVRPNTRSGSTGEDRQVGQTEARILDMIVRLPVDTDVREDDVIAVTDSTYDVGMPGRSFRVTDAPADGWQIARSVIAVEVLVPQLNETA